MVIHQILRYTYSLAFDNVRFARFIAMSAILITFGYFFTTTDRDPYSPEKVSTYVAAFIFLVLYLMLWFVDTVKHNAHHVLHLLMTMVCLVNLYHIYVSQLTYYHAYEFLLYYVISIVFIIRKDFIIYLVALVAILLTAILLFIPTYNMPLYDFIFTYIVVTIFASARLYSRIAVEEKLKMREQELEKYAGDLESFAHASSHDMREPLRTITNYLQLLRKRYGDQLDKSALDYIEYANQAAKNLYKLVGDILVYTSLSSTSMRKKLVDTQEMMESLLQDLRLLIQEKNATVTYTDLIPIYTDETLFKSVLSNLVVNGLKYNDSKHPHVDVAATSLENKVVIQVRDNGVGIPKKFHDKVLERFTRLHSHTDNKGSGLGLSIVKRIVDLNQGKIWLESDEGKGTTFFIELPQHEVQ